MVHMTNKKVTLQIKLDRKLYRKLVNSKFLMDTKTWSDFLERVADKMTRNKGFDDL